MEKKEEKIEHLIQEKMMREHGKVRKNREQKMCGKNKNLVSKRQEEKRNR